MNKKQRKAILDLIYLITFFIGVAFTLLNRLDWKFYILAFIVPFVITYIIGWLIPVKETKKKSNSRKPESNKTKKTTTKSEAVPHNRILPDDKILTLPLEKISWREFERLCYLYYKAKGYNPRETKEGADGGVDLIIYDPTTKEKEAVQIKHYIRSERQITVKEIRELDSAKKNHGCMLATFITSTTYTTEAMLQAGERKINTHQIEWVRNKIDSWRLKEAKKRKLIS